VAWELKCGMGAEERLSGLVPRRSSESFGKLSLPAGAPLRNRTVDLLLTIENHRYSDLDRRSYIYGISCDNVARDRRLRLDKAGRWPPRLAPIPATMRP